MGTSYMVVFFEKIENGICKFQKYQKQNRCILGYTKMINFELFKMCTFHHTEIHTFVIFLDQNTTNFGLIFLHTSTLYYYLHQEFLFQSF
jgi:hypothetical protein